MELFRRWTIAATLSDGAQRAATECVGVCEWQTRKCLFLKWPFHLTNWVKYSAMRILLKTYGHRILMRIQRAAERNVMHIAQLKRPTLFQRTFLQIIKGPLFQQCWQFDNIKVFLLNLAFTALLFNLVPQTSGVALRGHVFQNLFILSFKR